MTKINPGGRNETRAKNLPNIIHSLRGIIGKMSNLIGGTYASGNAGVVALAVRQDTATALAADGQYVPLIVDENGKLWVSVDSAIASGGLGTWTLDSTNSRGQGKVVLLVPANGTLTVAPFYTQMIATNIMEIKRFNAAGDLVTTYTHSNANITVALTTVTIDGEVFTAGDTFVLKYDGLERTTNLGSNAQMGENINNSEWTHQQSNHTAIAVTATGSTGATGTTTVVAGYVTAFAPTGAGSGTLYAVGDYFYIDGGTGDKAIGKVATLNGTGMATASVPYGGSGYTAGAGITTTKLTYINGANGSEIAPFKDLSFSGLLRDIDGVISLMIEGTNDKDGATDSRIWQPVYFYDDKLNTNVNLVTSSSTQNAYRISLNEFNFALYRIVLLTKTATYSCTCYQRVKAL